jgi:hypothetical protein
MSWHGFFSSYCHVGGCTIFKEVIQVIERFLLILGSLCRTTSLFFMKSLVMLHVCPILTPHGKIFHSLVLVNA